MYIRRRRPPRSTLLPYTTRVRSPVLAATPEGALMQRAATGLATVCLRLLGSPYGRRVVLRSEEHTSELQSRQYLVCRLLLDTTTIGRAHFFTLFPPFSLISSSSF